jgi:hypothetical protein
MTIYVFFCAKVNHDEVEHLIVAYRIMQGEQVFVDFDQNHMPFYWYILLPIVKLFSNSILSVYAGRALTLILVGITFFLGLKTLKTLKLDSPLLKATFFILFATMYIDLEMYRIRPDSFMYFFVSLAFIISLRTPQSALSSFKVGLFISLAAAFSIKLLPLLFAHPIALLIKLGIRNKSIIRPTLAYCLGGIVGALPLAAYFLVVDNWQHFYHDVVVLNRTLSKPHFESWGIRTYPFFLWIISLAYIWMIKKDDNLERRDTLMTSAVWALAAYLILFFTNHGAKYNFQATVLPTAICVTFLAYCMSNEIYSKAKIIALLTTVQLYIAPDAIFNRLSGGGLYMGELKEIIDLTAQYKEEPTCVGFAPVHPIFCKNVLPVYLEWDLLFLQQLRKKPLEDYYTRKWLTALNSLQNTKPDIVVERAFSNRWNDALFTIFSEQRKQDRWLMASRQQDFLTQNYRNIRIAQDDIDEEKKISIWLKK